MSAAETAYPIVGNLIFISYRRLDSAAQALALRVELESNLRAVQVFMDTHHIEAGDNWADQIESALDSSKVIIAVIGNSWEATTGEGQRRIDSPDDWIHRELKFALENRRQGLVPILVDGASPRSSEELPNPLRELASIEALRIDLSQWDSSNSASFVIVGSKVWLQGQKRNFRVSHSGSANG
jgi:hypothetical protein